MFISKPFTEYTAADYATAIGVNLTGFFWLTRCAIAEMARRYGGPRVKRVPCGLVSADDGPPNLAPQTRWMLLSARGNRPDREARPRSRPVIFTGASATSR